MKKQRKYKDGNAELIEKETNLETDSNLGSETNGSFDSKLEEGENSSREDARLETEQSAYSRVKRKKKGSSLIDEKRTKSEVNVSLESGLKEDVNTLLERECFASESELNELPLHSERKSKRKKKKKHKRGNSGQFEEEGPESVVEPRAKKENSVIDQKQSGSVVESKVNISLELGEKVSIESELKGCQLNEQPADSEQERKRKKKKEREYKMAKAGESDKLNQKSVVELRDRKENSLVDEKQKDSYVESKLSVSLESGLKEGANFSMKDSFLETDSQVQVLENISLGSGLRGNEQPDDEEKRKEGKREHKMAKAGQFEKLGAKSVLELRDVEENSLINEKKIDSHVESKLNVSSLESGRKEGANSDAAETLENVSLESRLNGTQLNDQMIQPEMKSKKRKREREKQEKRRLSVMQDNDLSSKRNYRDIDEAENNERCPNHQITNRKEFKKEDLISISENVESKNMKKYSIIPDKQIDSQQDARSSSMTTQILHVYGDRVVSEVKDNKTLKIYQRKRKKSSDLLGGSLEPVQENRMIQTSINQLEKEHKTGFSENRPDAVLVGEHAMPEQVMEEAFGNSADGETALKGRKRKRRNKLKESLCKDPEPKDVEMETKIEELIPSSLNLAVANDNAELKATIKQNNTSGELYSSLERVCTSCPKKKLLVLDLNGILVDVVQNPGEFKPDIRVSGKGVFKRPFCDDFLEFCFRTFDVGIWSSRINKNVNMLVGFLMRKWRRNLLFCWDRKQCTVTKFNTIEDRPKPLVLKELRKLWDKRFPNLPWTKGEYNESNTLLLDDSPYKALRNPANTAVFPYPYQYTDAEDSSLGRGGDIRTFLEGLAAADNVQKYVEQNPFGQPPITESNPHWDFYCQIIQP